MRRFLVIACLVCPPLLQAGTAPGAHEVPVGQALPDAYMRGLNGPSRQLASYLGKPLLINVWASWCEPCRAETASLERLAWRDPGRGYAIIGISTDDEAAQALRWLSASHATISHFIDHDLELEHMLGASHLPLTVFVDARGRVLERIYGAQEWDSAAALARIALRFGHGAHDKTNGGPG